ncbi:hypothetical protein NXF25_020960 [Crotalus adamanteus]|uniref:Connexin N-terminal domain-containing protein n=1 Tax=Crotalus adamanteus TaxID=8729 RepID=A0AAW1B6P5_CROAD
MATVIGGISRLFQPTIAVLSAEKICRGTNPWYFLIGLRMVTLFFAYGPWDSLKADLVCRWPSNIGDANKFCSAICYNQRFPVPISGFWVFHFIAIIFTVALLKFVYVTKKSPTDKDAEAARKPISGTEHSPKVGEELHFGGWRYGIYIFCIALLLAIDVAFIWTLLGFQLPNLIQEVTNCYPNDPACPATAQCAVNSISDKRAILWVLAFCSAANIVFCIGVLSAQCCHSCGLCRGPEKARPAEYGSHDHSAGCPGDRGRWTEVLSNRELIQAGAARCGCQPEGVSCCCRQGNEGSRGMACGCQNNRLCPCFFQGSDTGLSSLTGREDSEGKLLRGDTEIEGERKKWGAAENWMPTNEPVKMGAQRSQGSSRGGAAVKNMAKYQPQRNWRL